MASSLFCELTEEELSTVAAAGLKSEIKSYRLLSGGLFNTTYFVETADVSAVLRVGPVNRHLLMPFEHRLMQSEKIVYGLLAENGVPTSEIIYIDTSKSLIDRDFMFVKYIPSRAASEAEISDKAMAKLCFDVGAATARMHEIGADKFGRITEIAEGGGFDSWSDFLTHELCDWKSVGADCGIFTRDEIEEIETLFESAKPYLDEITVPKLVHTDLWLGNVLIGSDDSFAAIIDADRAVWGDPLFEFSSIRWTYSEPDFWRGYGKTIENSKANQIRCAVYTLLNRLWNSYVYLKEYNQPDNAEQEREDALRQILILRCLPERSMP